MFSIFGLKFTVSCNGCGAQNEALKITYSSWQCERMGAFRKWYCAAFNVNQVPLTSRLLMNDEECTPLNAFPDYDSVQGSIQAPIFLYRGSSMDEEEKGGNSHSNSARFTLECIEHILSHQHNLCLNGTFRPNSHVNLFVEDLKRWLLDEIATTDGNNNDCGGIEEDNSGETKSFPYTSYDVALLNMLKYIKLVVTHFEWCFPVGGTFLVSRSSTMIGHQNGSSSSSSSSFSSSSSNKVVHISPHESLLQLLSKLRSLISSHLVSRLRYQANSNRLKCELSEIIGHVVHIFNDGRKCLDFLLLSDTKNHSSFDIDSSNTAQEASSSSFSSSSFSSSSTQVERVSQLLRGNQLFQKDRDEVNPPVSPMYNTPDDVLLISLLNGGSMKTGLLDMSLSEHISSLQVFQPMATLPNQHAPEEATINSPILTAPTASNVVPASSGGVMRRKVTFSTLNLSSSNHRRKRCEDCVNIFENILSGRCKFVHDDVGDGSIRAISSTTNNNDASTQVEEEVGDHQRISDDFSSSEVKAFDEVADIKSQKGVEKDDGDLDLELDLEFNSKVYEALCDVKECWNDGKLSMFDDKNSGNIAMKKVTEILTCLLKLATLVGWLSECIDISTKLEMNNHNHDQDNVQEKKIDQDVNLSKYGISPDFFVNIQGEPPFHFPDIDHHQLPPLLPPNSEIESELLLQWLYQAACQNENETTDPIQNGDSLRKAENASSSRSSPFPILIDFPLKECLKSILKEANSLKLFLGQFYRQTSKLNQSRSFQWHHFMSPSMVCLGHLGHHLSVIQTKALHVGKSISLHQHTLSNVLSKVIVSHCSVKNEEMLLHYLLLRRKVTPSSSPSSLKSEEDNGGCIHINQAEESKKSLNISREIEKENYDMQTSVVDNFLTLISTDEGRSLRKRMLKARSF